MCVKRLSAPLVASHPVWALGTELRASARAGSSHLAHPSLYLFICLCIFIHLVQFGLPLCSWVGVIYRATDNFSVVTLLNKSAQTYI